MLVEVSRYVFAPDDVVWDVLTDWERQAEWMVDAQEVEVLSPHREGRGVRLRCPTNVLGVTLDDQMEVTAWEERQRLAVRHIGSVISGTGEFLLERTDVGTRVTWREDLAPPLGAVGEAGARALVRPYVRHLFGRSLDGLKEACERVQRLRRAVDGGEGAGS
jgi:carbon monoxide dehydrogenase subunit G